MNTVIATLKQLISDSENKAKEAEQIIQEEYRKASALRLALAAVERG